MEFRQVARQGLGQRNPPRLVGLAQTKRQIVAHVLEHQQAGLLPPDLGHPAAGLQQAAQAFGLVVQAVAQQHRGTREFAQQDAAQQGQEKARR